jgi:hypothetical protein
MASDFHAAIGSTSPSTNFPEAAVGPASIDWAKLVQQIQANDPAGMEALHKVFSRGLRYHIARRVDRQDLDDKIHDISIVVVKGDPT